MQIIEKHWIDRKFENEGQLKLQYFQNPKNTQQCNDIKELTNPNKAGKGEWVSLFQISCFFFFLFGKLTIHSFTATHIITDNTALAYKLGPPSWNFNTQKTKIKGKNRKKGLKKLLD